MAQADNHVTTWRSAPASGSLNSDTEDACAKADTSHCSLGPLSDSFKPMWNCSVWCPNDRRSRRGEVVA